VTRARFAAVVASVTILATAVSNARVFPATLKEHHMSSLADIQHTEGLRERTHAIDVFGIAQNIRVRTAIEPSKIETFSEVQKRHITDAHEIGELYAALERSKPAAAKQAVEYRWKLVAYDAGGTRIAEIYLSAITPYGMYGDGEFFVLANGDFEKQLSAALGHASHAASTS
jgi:hypothetical protein